MRAYLVKKAILIGFMACGLTAVASVHAQAQQMSFRLVPAQDPAKCGDKCLQFIAAEGEIVDDTPNKFIEFIDANKHDQRIRTVILFHSPGGKVGAALQLGFVLRKLGADTVVARALSAPSGGGSGIVAGRCYSSCVYAIMGGKKRVIPLDSEVGIHRSYVEEYGEPPKREILDAKPLVDPDLILKLVGAYSDRMGVSRGLVEEAQRTSSRSIHIVTRAEMARWRLAGSRL